MARRSHGTGAREGRPGGNRAIFLGLPGEGAPEGINITVDTAALLGLVAAELKPLMSNPITPGSPPLKPATIKRRKSRGVTSTVPLIDTGGLRASVEIKSTERGIEIWCADFVKYLPGAYWKNFLSTKAINAAVNRAVQKFIAQMVKVT